MTLNQFIARYEAGERFVVFDVETVGNGDGMRIVEIGAVEAGKGVARQARTFQSILRYRPPSWRPYHYALRVHKIPTREIEDGAPRDEVLEAFLDFIEGATLVCHTGYDVRAMRIDLQRHAHLARHVEAPIWSRYLDSCKLARKAWPDLKRHTLSHLSAHLSIVNPDAHRALADALTTKKILARILREHYKRTPRAVSVRARRER